MIEKKVVQFTRMEELQAIRCGVVFAIDWLENFVLDTELAVKAGFVTHRETAPIRINYNLEGLKALKVRLDTVIEEWQGDL